MADTTWLQAVIPKDEWDKLNDRRKALGLKWGDILLPACKAYLKGLEATSPPAVVDKPQKPESKRERRARVAKGLEESPTVEEVEGLAAILEEQH